jgi:hypothetical protein
MSIFNFLMFDFALIGLLLIILGFYGYSNLGVNCILPSLKTKLTISITIGAVLLSLAIGFIACKRSCKCGDFEFTKTKKYMLAIFSLLSGIGLLILTFSIKSDLDDVRCNVDLSTLTWIFSVLSSLQIIASIIFFIFMIKDTPKPKPKIEPEIEEHPDFISARETSIIQEERKKQKNILNIQVTEKTAALEKLKTRKVTLEQKPRKNPEETKEFHDVSAKITNINSDLEKINKQITEIGNSGDSNDSRVRNVRERDRLLRDY